MKNFHPTEPHDDNDVNGNPDEEGTPTPELQIIDTGPTADEKLHRALHRVLEELGPPPEVAPVVKDSKAWSN